MNPAPAATTNNASEELKYFLELTGIPRPSGHLARIRKYLAGFASQHGLECKTDESGNVLIIKPGTEEKTIILQSHQDMVPQSLRDFDFENDKLN
ncbi:MAG: hypothetical protein J5494_07195, partial [Candidatus Methanomethylophilaceae archaeon]|nr:hypothetical protein [Candidatus Methanomethylophilaceae archaeon]